jgi:hypothetical protein
MIVWCIPWCVDCLGEGCVVQSAGTPRPGDPALCTGCAELFTFDEDLLLRRPTAAEVFLFAMADDSDWWGFLKRMIGRTGERCSGK